MEPVGLRADLRALAIAASVLVLSGCAAAPAMRGTERVNALVKERGVAGDVAWPGDSRGVSGAREAVVAPSGELSREEAIRQAFMHNAKVRELYAELGVAAADIAEAGRIANPRFGYVSLSPWGEGANKITRAFSLDFTNVLMLSSRTRLARAEFERSRELVADALLELAMNVEARWYEAVAARQIVELRSISTTASDAAGEMAQRLLDAGNVSPKAAALEQASASEQRALLARAKAEAITARAALADAIGLSTREAWEVPARLPAVGPELRASEADLVAQAQKLRLDLSASRREVATSADLAGVTRRWRWVGEVEGGYERESEPDGARLRGPSLSVQLPIFNQNQGGVLRAEAQVEAAEARLAEMELRVRNDIARSLDRLSSAREIAEAYRSSLLPLHETLVDRTQEEQNYMLVGVFDLLQARRTQLEAYEAYLETVRDYWIAMSELRRAAGGVLPGDTSGAPAAGSLTPGFDQLLAPSSSPSLSGPAGEPSGSDAPGMPAHDHGADRHSSNEPPSNNDDPSQHHHHGATP